MHRQLVIGCLLALASSAALAGNDKVTLCHKGDTITVAEPAVQAHLGHGDNRGECRPRQAEGRSGDDADATPHSYRYYRDAEVYYDEDRGRYYYLQGDDWTSSATPPSGFALNPMDAVALILNTGLPYQRHSDTLLQYPPLRRHPYRYYPEAGLYFDAARTLFFIYSQGRWQTVNHAPSGFFPDRVRYEEVLLDVDRPWLRHDEMLERFGSPRSHEADGHGKADVCHKGKTLSVGGPAVSAHVGHGDTRGPCGGEDSKHEGRDRKDHDDHRDGKKSRKEGKGRDGDKGRNKDRGKGHGKDKK